MCDEDAGYRDKLEWCKAIVSITNGWQTEIVGLTVSLDERDDEIDELREAVKTKARPPAARTGPICESCEAEARKFAIAIEHCRDAEVERDAAQAELNNLMVKQADVRRSSTLEGLRIAVQQVRSVSAGKVNTLEQVEKDLLGIISSLECDELELQP